MTGESTESVTAALRGPLSEAVIGWPSSEPEVLSAELERSVARNSSARSALDCALYDLAARTAEVPLFRYLGATASEVRTEITVSATIDEAGIEHFCRAALEFANAGLHTLKIKVGAGGDDVKAALAVRDAATTAIE